MKCCLERPRCVWRRQLAHTPGSHLATPASNPIVTNHKRLAVNTTFLATPETCFRQIQRNAQFQSRVFNFHKTSREKLKTGIFFGFACFPLLSLSHHVSELGVWNPFLKTKAPNLSDCGRLNYPSFGFHIGFQKCIWSIQQCTFGTWYGITKFY